MQGNAKTNEYLLDILRCRMHGLTPSPKPQEITWKSLFSYSKSQSLGVFVWDAIKPFRSEIEPEIAEAWKTYYMKHLVKCENQEDECSEIQTIFSNAGIKTVSLKGSTIRHLFPEKGFREMCDLDILIPLESVEQAHQIMIGRGYDCIDDHTTSHNREYHKPPYLSVELHSYMVPQESIMFSYYSNIWDKMLLTEKPHCYKLSWNDSYIYFLAHAYKHFFLRGIGVRSVLDIYVMHQKLADVLDHTYIDMELEKLGIADFADKFERLSDCWFSPNKTPVAPDLLDYHQRILSGGTFGDPNVLNTRVFVMRQEGKSLRIAKLIIAMKKVFPPFSYMKTMYPVLQNVPILLPVFWIVRWFETILLKPTRIKVFFRNLKQVSPSNKKQ